MTNGDEMTNAEIVLEAIRAVEERNAERLLDLYHDDVEIHDAPSLPYGGVARGKASIQEQLQSPETTWLGTWDPLQPTEAERRMDPRVVASDGDQVVVLYRQRAVSASGERLDSPVLALYEVRDGKFARAQMFHFDTLAIRDFLTRVHENSDSTA
jgi:ketosteroid isomerase-like protein